MSTVRLTIATQPKDFSWAYGAINLQLQVQGVTYNLNLTMSPIDGYKRFREVEWFSPQAQSNYAQAQTYALAVNRDYRQLGNEPSEFLQKDNIRATVNDSSGDAVVEIFARKGIFANGVYTGNLLIVSFEYDNTTQSDPLTFAYAATGEGDCLNQEYQVNTATGGTPPYRLNLNGNNFVTAWDGETPTTFDLKRANTYSGALYDATGLQIRTVQINPTKNLAATDFQIETLVYASYADLKINTVVPRAGTTPLEYNLVNSEGVESGWQSSNIFGGLTGGGNYIVKIRDKFECEVSKTAIVPDIADPLIPERVDYFKVSEFNSLSFFREVEHSESVRKNYENTPSYLENVALPKNGYFSFPASRRIRTQFKSSYPNHVVTLHRPGSTPVELPFFEIQQNLGVTEKVDCELFPVQKSFTGLDGSTVNLTSGVGVFFDGGVQYEPNSTTPKADPDSPYTSGLPGWAKVGNLVSIDGIGSFEIIETDLYDEARDVMYFLINSTLPEQSARIQASWDRHPYNVFRTDFDMSLVTDRGAFVRIEPGVAEDGLLVVDQNNIHRSEWIVKITDTSNYLKFQWSAFRNLGEMLFIDGIVCEMWVKGRIRPFSSTNAEFDDADDRTRSLDQKSYLRMRATIPLMSVRHWRKLDLVGAIGNRGKVLVEDMEVVRINASEVEEQGLTNVSNVSVDLAFAGENTAISQEDPVYDIETGGTKTAKTGREEITGWEGIRLITEDGYFIKVDDAGQEKYVVID